MGGKEGVKGPGVPADDRGGKVFDIFFFLFVFVFVTMNSVKMNSGEDKEDKDLFKRAILLVLDGLGDRPVDEFAGLTPLEFANTGNLDKLAALSECGMMHTLSRGRRPAGDVAHLAIFGYDIETYYTGRGPIEVAGTGFDMKKGDVALRGNLGSVDFDGVIKDRRMGRNFDAAPFLKELDGLEIEGIRFMVKPGIAHRAGVIMRGENLSGSITDADPLEPNVPVRRVDPTDDTEEAKFTAGVLNKFLSTSHAVLEKLELNETRRKMDKLPANYLLVRGAGRFNGIQLFNERYGLSASCIAGTWFQKCLANYLGMKVLNVPGATGMANTDIETKFKVALGQLESQDFVFVHVKAADFLGRDGNPQGKKDFIEKIDHAVKLFLRLPEDVLVVVTSSYSTPCDLKTHSADPVPIMFCGNGVRTDKVDAFGERTCAQGTLGYIEGKDVMPHILNLLGRPRGV